MVYNSLYKIKIKGICRIITIIILILILTFVSGCGSYSGISANMGTGNSGRDKSETGYVAPTIEEERAKEISSISKADDEIQKAVTEKDGLGITDEALQSVMSEQVGRYCYDVMDDSLHKLYAEILMILDKEVEDVYVSTNDADELQYVFQCVYCDHPEIFWIDGYSYTRHTKGKEIIYLTFSGKYIYSRNERKSKQISINNYVSKALSGVGRNTEEYEIVKHIYDYIITHTEYDLASEDNQTILSVFLNGKSVCQGYAKAMQYLLVQAGIEATLVVGRVNTGEGHAWNLVKIDGAYYYVDPTWGDASYILDGNSMDSKNMPINYGYLNITTKELLLTHQIESVVTMPMCVSDAANYYVKEGLYFTSYNELLLQEAFEKAYASGWENISLKCANADVYEQMCNELLNNQFIFSLLQNPQDSVVYSLSDNECTLNFWL